MKLKTPVAVLAEQRPGASGYLAGLLKGDRKGERLSKLFSALGDGRKVFIAVADTRRLPPYLKRAAAKFGAQIINRDALPGALRSSGFRSAAVLSPGNELFSAGMFDRMAAKLKTPAVAHMFFKPGPGIPYNTAEVHVVSADFIEKNGIRGLGKIKGLPYELEARDKIWLFGEAAKNRSSYPRLVAIEPTNLCNLRCSMCPVHSSPGSRKKRASGMMDFGLYKRIINQLPERSKVNLVLHGYGEPLLHPRIADMIAYAKKSGINDVQFATNGMLLTGEKSAALIASGMDRLDVSLDGFTAKEYEAIRIGADFKTVKENIARFLMLRGKRSKPVLNIRLVKQTANKNSVGGFIKYWAKTADTVTVDECHDEGSVKHSRAERFPCPALRLLMEIYWDGTVVLCNMDAFAKNKLGNLKQDKLLDIWNGRKLNRIRGLHNKLVFNRPAICGKCGWWQCFDIWKSCDLKGLSCMKNPVTAIWSRGK